MNYGNMTDFEINKLIAKAIGFNLCEGQHYKPRVTHWLGGECKTFDPCSSPSDAWPIILENKIGMNKLKCEPLWIADKGGNYVRSKNPLRAAMIVYLMM